jgi:hypothetical protein
VDAGYEPGRIHLLTRHTLESIDALGALSSSDSAAADAIRTIRLARSNLEDQWMPALRDIERSDLMVRWRASQLTTVGSRLLPSLTASIPVRRREQLLRRLDFLERKMLGGDADVRAGRDPTGTPSDKAIGELGRQLAFWVRRDDRFADELVERSASSPIVGLLLGEARFPTSFAADVARRMATPNGPDTDVDHDRYAMSLSTVLASMTDDPAACLDLLLDQPTTYALASWKALHASMLADFVVSGLHVAIEAAPDRLADGYRVVEFLTRAANGPLDGGMSAGMATGLAASLPGYIDTLAPAIEQEGSTPVVIRAVDPPIELGTYDELADLFGALVRVPEAQSALGTTIAAYTFDTFERLGGDATRRSDVTHLADFADLVGDASRTEHAELLMAAAVDEARRRQLSGMIGFGTNVALLAGGAGSVTRAIAAQAVRAATSWRRGGEPERLPEGQIAAQTYDLITVAAVAVAASDPAMRHDAGLDDVTAAQWAETNRRVDAIEQLDDPHERTLTIGALDHWIDTSVPALAGYLLGLRTMPGMSELKEARTAVGTD